MLSPIENWLVLEQKKFCHLYSRGTDTRHRKHMSRDHTQRYMSSPWTRKTHASSIAACRSCLQNCCLATRWSNLLHYLLLLLRYGETPKFYSGVTRIIMNFLTKSTHEGRTTPARFGRNIEDHSDSSVCNFECNVLNFSLILRSFKNLRYTTCLFAPCLQFIL
jgi:hypothetical protein